MVASRDTKHISTDEIWLPLEGQILSMELEGSPSVLLPPNLIDIKKITWKEQYNVADTYFPHKKFIYLLDWGLTSL